LWLALSLASAVFAALVSVLGKKGLAGVPSNLATAVRALVALVLSWALVFISGGESGLEKLGTSSILFILLSGLATGASWLLYFQALKLGRVTQVVAVDRVSLIFTGVFAILLFGETENLWFKLLGLLLVFAGTFLLIGRVSVGGFAWFWPALGSMLFAVATALLAKFGLAGIDSTLATALRTIVVVVFAFAITAIRGELKSSSLNLRNGWFLVLSGLATGASWLCYFGALKLGELSLVAPIDKLSIVFAAFLSYLFLGEKVSRRDLLGLAVVVVGSVTLLL
jgi:transporter family protein